MDSHTFYFAQVVKADLPLPLYINIVPVADASLLWQQAQNLTSKLDGCKALGYRQFWGHPIMMQQNTTPQG